MRMTTFGKNPITATMLALLVAAGTAFADKDNKGGDRGGGDRGDRGSSRSNSGGSDRSSSRSSGRSSDNERSTFRGQGSDDSNKDFKSFQFKQSDQGQQFRQGSRDYQARRPSDNQDRDVINNFNNNRSIDRFKDRSPQDKALVDREFNQWRNTWNGDKNDKGNKGDKIGSANNDRNSFDHRDWSGNWKNSDRFTIADRMRNDWRGRKDRNFVFGDSWWSGNRHGNAWNFWGDYGRRGHRSNYWWSWANGPRLASWFVFGWPTPYYWDYGPGEYIYADNGAVYVNGRWYEPAPVFYRQTEQIVDRNPPLTAEAAAKLEWLPLGVFAATPDGLNEPEVMVQLATTKDGIIGGTAFDQKTGAAYAIQGTVDQKTQRAVWSYRNDRNQRIMMESSIYNLTQPEATGLVHYSPTDMRVVELVRLQQPDADSAGGSTLPAPPVAQ